MERKPVNVSDVQDNRVFSSILDVGESDQVLQDENADIMLVAIVAELLDNNAELNAKLGELMQQIESVSSEVTTVAQVSEFILKIAPFASLIIRFAAPAVPVIIRGWISCLFAGAAEVGAESYGNVKSDTFSKKLEEALDDASAMNQEMARFWGVTLKALDGPRVQQGSGIADGFLKALKRLALSFTKAKAKDPGAIDELKLGLEDLIDSCADHREYLLGCQKILEERAANGQSRQARGAARGSDEDGDEFSLGGSGSGEKVEATFGGNNDADDDAAVFGEELGATGIPTDGSAFPRRVPSGTCEEALKRSETLVTTVPLQTPKLSPWQAKLSARTVPCVSTTVASIQDESDDFSDYKSGVERASGSTKDEAESDGLGSLPGAVGLNRIRGRGGRPRPVDRSQLQRRGKSVLSSDSWRGRKTDENVQSVRIRKQGRDEKSGNDDAKFEEVVHVLTDSEPLPSNRNRFFPEIADYRKSGRFSLGSSLVENEQVGSVKVKSGILPSHQVPENEELVKPNAGNEKPTEDEAGNENVVVENSRECCDLSISGVKCVEDVEIVVSSEFGEVCAEDVVVKIDEFERVRPIPPPRPTSKKPESGVDLVACEICDRLFPREVPVKHEIECALAALRCPTARKKDVIKFC